MHERERDWEEGYSDLHGRRRGKEREGPLIAFLIRAGSDINNVIDPFFALHKFSFVSHGPVTINVISGSRHTYNNSWLPKIQDTDGERGKYKNKRTTWGNKNHLGNTAAYQKLRVKL